MGWEEVGEAWAALGEAEALQDDYPGVTARQVPVYGGFGLAAWWRVGRRELRVIGPAVAVREAVEENPPRAAVRVASKAPAGEAPPRTSPAGTAAALPPGYCAFCKKPIYLCKCIGAAGDCPEAPAGEAPAPRTSPAGHEDKGGQS